MAALRNMPHYTYEDYRRWEGSWELWRGRAVAMSPSPGFDHGELVIALATRIREQLKAKDNCSDCHITTEVDWKIDDDLVIHPDIAVVCGERPKVHIEHTPTLIVEVLSPATQLRDRNEKRDICDEQGVKHYFLADPKTLTLQDARASEQPTLHRLELHGGCSVELPISWKGL